MIRTMTKLGDAGFVVCFPDKCVSGISRWHGTARFQHTQCGMHPCLVGRKCHFSAAGYNTRVPDIDNA